MLAKNLKYCRFICIRGERVIYEVTLVPFNKYTDFLAVVRPLSYQLFRRCTYGNTIDTNVSKSKYKYWEIRVFWFWVGFVLESYLG